MKILALLVNILGIGATIFSGFMVMMSPMMFDAPGSTESKSLWFVVGGLLLLPILLIIAEFFGWKNFMAGNYMASIFAYKWALLDFILVIIIMFTKSS